MNKPLAGDSLADTVRTEIERELLDGALAPGQVLDERSLAERFGVSRTPVREAVQALAATGLLRVMPRAGVVVPKLSMQELLALLEMLAELEGICAAFAAKRMDGAERKLLQNAVLACETAARAAKPKAYSAANARFHEAIYQGARNEWAAQHVRNLRLRCAGYMRPRFDLPGQLEDSLAEHRLVLKHIQAGDAEGARRAMTEHIAVGGKGFARFVSLLDPRLLSDR